MSSQWHVSTNAGPLLKEQLASLDQCFQIDGKLISKGPRNDVLRAQIEKQVLYIKRYTGEKTLRRYIGRSRLRCEWENLHRFEQWGLSIPPIVAYGETYQGGRFQRGALVTLEVPESRTLWELAEDKHPLINDWQRFRPFAKQLAHYTRTLHDHGFAHNDLDWRNILVQITPDGGGKIFFFDCPKGQHWTWPFLSYRIMKDLAHLDKLARQYLPLRWRLWFFKQYTGRNKLTTADKKLLNKIQHFYDEQRYRRRWRI